MSLIADPPGPTHNPRMRPARAGASAAAAAPTTAAVAAAAAAACRARCRGAAQPLSVRVPAASMQRRQGGSSTTTRGSAAAGVVPRAYVGQDSPLAGAYYTADFEWAQHARETAAQLEAQWAAAPAAVRDAAQLDPATGVPLSAVAQLLRTLPQYATGSDGSSSSNGSGHQVPAAAAGLHTSGVACVDQAQQPAKQQQPATQQQQQQQQQPANAWEAFYAAHPAARFFKERRYLLLEFPALAPPVPLGRVVEIGAGCGSSILPVLRAQPAARATVCDVSATCLAQLAAAAAHLGLDDGRLDAFVADGTDPALVGCLAGAAADACLIMFTLSAVEPPGMLAMLANARAALRPGGLLCIRDHALADMVQLRIPPEQCIARHLYRRSDGTLAYFYTTDELAGLAAAAGFEVVECDYVCVVNRNRKTGQQLRRAFVHGLFRRPS